MTYEKALEMMRRKYDAAKDYTDDLWEGSERREHREYVDMLVRAIEALEKQIPKKPHKNRSEYFCPSCEDSPCVGKNHRDGHKTRDDFCFRCGQALDWCDEPPKEDDE